MKKSIKLPAIIFTILIISLVFGSSNIKDIYKSQQSAKIYFNKGVYKADSFDNKNPYKNYFYVFYDKTSGRTENSKNGIGLPFFCAQKDGYVTFKFGGIEEPEEIFKIKSVKNGVIKGYFKDDSLLIFTPVVNGNPDNFDAVEYIKRR